MTKRGFQDCPTCGAAISKVRVGIEAGDAWFVVCTAGHRTDIVGLSRADPTAPDAWYEAAPSPAEELQEHVEERARHEARIEQLKRAIEVAKDPSNASLSDLELLQSLKGTTPELPISVEELADRIGCDVRGLRRRMPRMVKDGLINGGPDTGYWAVGGV